MDLEDFWKDFMQAVNVLAVDTGDFKEAAFVTESTRRLIEAEELTGFEPCHFEGVGTRNRNLRIDGYWFDDVDETVSLIVAFYQGESADSTLTQTDVTRYFNALTGFVADALSGKLKSTLEESTPAYGLVCDLLEKKDSIARFRAILVSDASLSARVKYQPEGEVTDIPVEYHIWDITRFFRVHESTLGRDELEVDFTEFVREGLPCLQASQSHDGYKAYLCVIPAEILSTIYARFGSRLLEGNVRSFLSVTGKVNKAIRNSILYEPGMFFAFNNGISATATDVSLENTASGIYLRSATHLQIVNGGQTTASIATAKRKDKANLDQIYVPMKLSVISPDVAEKVIPRISYCANSQNKVSEADFFANHPFHIRIEEFSRRLWAPATHGAQYETHWFYERARGQYTNEQVSKTASEKNRFLLQNPRNQLITKTDLAKYEISWLQKPYIVSRGAQKNFLEFAKWVTNKWNTDETEINEEYFRSMVAKAIIFRHTERIINEQPWYQNGYRANIVTYTVARLVLLIEQQAPGDTLDLRSIWASSEITPELEAQIKLTAKAVFDVIVSPIEQYQNITEWCKNELCWERATQTPVVLSQQLRDQLNSVEKVRVDRREAKILQRTDTGIQAQKTVVNLGSSYWDQLFRFGYEAGRLSNEQLKVVKSALYLDRKVPNEHQAKLLLQIKELMEKEGFQVK